MLKPMPGRRLFKLLLVTCVSSVLLAYAVATFAQDDDNPNPDRDGGSNPTVGPYNPTPVCVEYCDAGPTLQQKEAAYAARLRQEQQQQQQQQQKPQQQQPQALQRQQEIKRQQEAQAEKARQQAAFEQGQADALRSMKGISGDHLALKGITEGSALKQLEVTGYHGQGATHSLHLETTGKESGVGFDIAGTAPMEGSWFPKVSSQVSRTPQYLRLYQQQQGLVRQYRAANVHIVALQKELTQVAPAASGKLQIALVAAKQARSDIANQAGMVRYKMLNLSVSLSLGK